MGILGHLQKCGYARFEYWEGTTLSALPGHPVDHNTTFRCNTSVHVLVTEVFNRHMHWLWFSWNKYDFLNEITKSI